MCVYCIFWRQINLCEKKVQIFKKRRANVTRVQLKQAKNKQKKESRQIQSSAIN